MDADQDIDVAEMKRALDAADVTSLYFPFLGKSLILDLRSSATEGPIVTIVPQVASGEERMRSLRRLRPRFPRPERLTLIAWPKLVDSLARLGVWDHVLARCSEYGSPDLVRRCQACLAELREAETASLRDAVRGEGFETIWERQR